MKPNIRHRLFFPHPPEAVWEYLTNSELMELWLMKNDFQPAVGHEFQFRTNPIPKMEFDGIVYCKVLELVPAKRLVYSWKGGPSADSRTLDSLVVWTLTPAADGTELILEHSGFTDLVNIHMYDAMNAGWLKNMHTIGKELNVVHGTTHA